MYNCSWWFGFSSISFYQKAALLSSLAAFLMSNFGLLFFYSPFLRADTQIRTGDLILTNYFLGVVSCCPVLFRFSSSLYAPMHSSVFYRLMLCHVLGWFLMAVNVNVNVNSKIGFPCLPEACPGHDEDPSSQRPAWPPERPVLNHDKDPSSGGQDGYQSS